MCPPLIEFIPYFSKGMASIENTAMYILAFIKNHVLYVSPQEKSCGGNVRIFWSHYTITTVCHCVIFIHMCTGEDRLLPHK